MIKNKRQRSDIRTQFIQLASHLRQESLYVSSERAQLKKLNEKIIFKWQDVIRSAWVARQQRVALDTGVSSSIGSGSSTDLAAAAKLYNVLERVHFVESYKVLGSLDGHYSDFLSTLRRDTHFLARLLAAIEKRPQELSSDILSNEKLAELIITSLYGNCLFSQDRTFVAALLRELIGLQLVGSENPRRLLRQGNCMMARIYKHFSEGIFETRIFLTAALQQPVLQVLQQDDLYLDTDPFRSISRFAADERRRHFGEENTPEFERNMEKYKSWTISRLVTLVSSFIDGIHSQLACFPAWNTWLIRQLMSLLGGQMPDAELCAIGSDLIFGLFICPAILNPELHGITDTHISHIARYNLMQIAQTIQRLAVSRWDPQNGLQDGGISAASASTTPSSKLEPFYEKLPCQGIYNVLDTIMGQSPTSSPPPMPPLDENDIHRTSALITHGQLLDLVKIVHNVLSSVSETPPQQQPSNNNLNHNPNDFISSFTSEDSPSKETYKKIVACIDQVQLQDAASTGSPVKAQASQDFEQGFSVIDRREANRISTPTSLQINHSRQSTSTSSPVVQAKNLFHRVTSRRRSSAAGGARQNESALSGIGNTGSSGTGSSTTSGTQNDAHLDLIEDVLVVPLIANGLEGEEPIMSENNLFAGIGLHGEERVILNESELSSRRKSRVRVQLDSQSDHLMETESVISATSGDGLGAAVGGVGGVVDGVVVGPNIGEKRTRFSLSVDQESVGTMDNLEAISEAASNHSVDSSLDTAEDEEADGLLGTDGEEEVEGMENILNDNLSDMVSANVSSGRGSPNVSGRDSPISRGSSTESDDNDHHDHHHHGAGHRGVAAEGPVPVSPVLGAAPNPHRNNTDNSPAETLNRVSVSIGVGTSDRVVAAVPNAPASSVTTQSLSQNGPAPLGQSLNQPAAPAGRMVHPPSRHGPRPPAHSRRPGGGHAGGGYGPGTAAALRRIPVTHSSRANNREDIEDKFGKFDVKNQVYPPGDETKSIMSDTCSTDVLASDSEQTDQQPDRTTPGARGPTGSQSSADGHGGRHGGQELAPGGPSSGALSLLDESQSDAWSTSVAASDTARFQDFDSDEASSTRSESLVDRSDMEELSQQQSVRELNRPKPKSNIVSGPVNKTDNQGQEHPLTASTDSTDTVQHQNQPQQINAPKNDEKETAGVALRNSSESDKSGNEPGPQAGIIITGPSPTQTTTSPIVDQLSAQHRQTLGRLSFDICKLDELGSPSSPPVAAINNHPPLMNGNVQDLLSMDLSQLALSPSSSNVSNHSGGLAANQHLQAGPAGSHVDRSSAERSQDDEDDGVLIDLESCSPNDIGPVVPEMNQNPNSLNRASRPINININGGTPSAASGAIPKTRPQNQSSSRIPTTSNGPTTTPRAAPTSSARGSTGRRLLSGPINTFRAVKDKIQRPSPSSGGGSRRSSNQSLASNHNHYHSDQLSPSTSQLPSTSTATPLLHNVESTDDILEKYRSPRPPPNSIATSATANNDLILNHSGGRRHPSEPDTPLEDNEDFANQVQVPLDEATLMVIARRKLRRVLSQMDVHNLPVLPVTNSSLTSVISISQQSSSEGAGPPAGPGPGQQLANSIPPPTQPPNAIVRLLSVLLAEARCLQNTGVVVNLHEAIRIVSLLDESACEKLLAAVREDFQRRSVYIAYLSRSRNQLLSIHSQLEHMNAIVGRESTTTVQNFIGSFVRQYLEVRDDGRELNGFVVQFQALSSSTPPAPSDERTQCVRQFFKRVLGAMQAEQTWAAMTEEQRILTERSVERLIMREIYIYAFYPNGDGDVLRDQILHDHIQRLATFVTVNHRDLQIPRRYHLEAPWPSAQAELATLAAYKCPRDKVACVQCMCAILMNLLSHAAGHNLAEISSSSPIGDGAAASSAGAVSNSIENHSAPAAADDIIPVLVYVIIQTNPPGLLSTLQFVSSFHEWDSSEEEYLWTLFASAVEFIKTID